MPCRFPAQTRMRCACGGHHTYSCRACEQARNPTLVGESLFRLLSCWCCLVLDCLGGTLQGQVACYPLTYLYLSRIQKRKP